MIDVALSYAPAHDLVALDLWAGELPDLGDVRALTVEPRRWWLIDAGVAIADTAQRVGTNGAITPFGGGVMRATITGSGWRTLLSISCRLDIGRLAIGTVASTMIHHVPVRIVPIAEDTCEVFCRARYASTLDTLWHGGSSGE